MFFKEKLGYFGDDPQHDFDELGIQVMKIQIKIKSLDPLRAKKTFINIDQMVQFRIINSRQ